MHEFDLKWRTGNTLPKACVFLKWFCTIWLETEIMQQLGIFPLAGVQNPVKPRTKCFVWFVHWLHFLKRKTNSVLVSKPKIQNLYNKTHDAHTYTPSLLFIKFVHIQRIWLCLIQQDTCDTHTHTVLMLLQKNYFVISGKLNIKNNYIRYPILTGCWVTIPNILSVWIQLPVMM